MQRFIVLGASSPTLEFCLRTFDKYFLDDNLWCQAMSTGQFLDDHRCGQMMSGDERVLWSMIRLGILDKEGIDKPWDTSTRSMRQRRNWGQAVVDGGEGTTKGLFFSSVVVNRKD